MDDRVGIENLMVLYTEALDGGRFDLLGDLFADGTVTIEGGPQDGSVATGREQVAGLYRSIVALDADTGATGTRHFISNLFMDIGGDDAATRSYFAVSQQNRSLPLQLVACGAYHDTYTRHGGSWRFSRRHIVCDQVGDLSSHMR